MLISRRSMRAVSFAQRRERWCVVVKLQSILAVIIVYVPTERMCIPIKNISCHFTVYNICENLT
jgi:hypothetical protein